MKYIKWSDSRCIYCIKLLSNHLRYLDIPVQIIESDSTFYIKSTRNGILGKSDLIDFLSVIMSHIDKEDMVYKIFLSQMKSLINQE